jgi:4a-hydroxytetrahydrobiopterin dehydratase
MSAMKSKDIQLELKSIPKWSRRGQTLLRTYEFKEFMQGLQFVTRVAKRAEKSQHHPDIDIRYNKVTLKLTTHDEGGITDKDFAMARQCDEVYAKL